MIIRTSSNINDALSRTSGITVRNTGGVGSASRISVRGLEGKRMGVYIDEAAVGQLSDYMSPVKIIDGLPRSNGHGVAMGLFGNKMVYGSANDEYKGFSTVDLTTGEVENKIVTVEGFPSFFYSFK